MTPGADTEADEHESAFERNLDRLVASLLGDVDPESPIPWAKRVVDAVLELPGIAAAVIVNPGATRPVLAFAGPPIDPSTSTVLCGEVLAGGTASSRIASHDALPGYHAFRVGRAEAMTLRLTAPDSIPVDRLAGVLLPAAVAARRLDERRILERQLSTHREIERNIAESLSGVNDLEALGRAVIRVMSLLFDVEQSAIYFRDPSSKPLRLVATHGFEDWELADAERTAWDRHPGRVVRSGRMFKTDDVRLDLQGSTDNSARRIEIRSRCWLPVHAAGEVVGALGAASPRVAAFRDEHIQGFQFLADLAGLTWTRLIEQVRRETRDRILIAAGDATEDMLSARRWRDVLPDVLGKIQSAFRCESARFVELDGTSHGGRPQDPAISTAFVEEVHRHEEGGIVGTVGTSNLAPTRPLPFSSPFVAVPVSADDDPVGILLVVDASEARVHDRHSIAALRAFADPLAARIARDRLEESLRQSDRMDALGQLAGGVAHDINNLLMPVLGLASQLAETEPDPIRRDRIESIQHAAERGREFVEQVLLLTRRRVATDERTMLAPLIEQVAADARSSAPPEVRIETEQASPELAVMGDRTAIHRMLENLVLNAVQSIGEPNAGRIRIVAATSAEDQVEIVVSDDGCGIPDDIRRRLFEPFFTTRRSSSERGLGLTIVHRVVTELGGTIDVESAVGEGTSFRVVLPRVEASAEAAPGPAPARIGTEPAIPVAEGDRWILIVDDDAMVRRTTCALVESFGHRVEDAINGTEAIARIASSEQPPCLVLTDLSMPGIDGIELIRRIRSDGFVGRAAVITGYGEDAFDSAEKAGVDIVLRKPISRKELGEAIDALLGRSA